MSEPEPVEPRQPERGWRDWVLPVVAALVLLTLVLSLERLPSEGGAHRRAILAELRRLEHAVRNHEAFTWLHPKGHVPGTPDNAVHEAAQAQMLSDLDRLGHLEGFMMSQIEIRVTGDTAVAFYTVEGRASPPPGIGKATPKPVPLHGEAHFARTAQGWRMTAHRLW